MTCSFVINGVIFGTLNSFGTIFVHLKAELEMLDDGEEENSTASHAARASLVGALAIGSTFILSPVAGILGDRYGLRWTAICGGVIATLGMLLSSMVIHNVSIDYCQLGNYINAYVCTGQDHSQEKIIFVSRWRG